MTEIDPWEVAKVAAEDHFLPRMDGTVAPDHVQQAFINGFAAAVEQLPSRDEIAECARKELISFTGDCVCHEAYTSRGRTDPDCVWHAVGDDFPTDMADAVLALVWERFGLERCAS